MGLTRRLHTPGYAYRLRAALPVPSSQGIEWIIVWHLEACLGRSCWRSRGSACCCPSNCDGHNDSVCGFAFAVLVPRVPHVQRAFLDYGGDISFVIGVLLLSPVLMAMSPLVRYREWVGLAGAVVLLATSLAMMIHNGCSRRGNDRLFSCVGILGPAGGPASRKSCPNRHSDRSPSCTGFSLRALSHRVSSVVRHGQPTALRNRRTSTPMSVNLLRGDRGRRERRQKARCGSRDRRRRRLV